MCQPRGKKYERLIRQLVHRCDVDLQRTYAGRTATYQRKPRPRRPDAGEEIFALGRR